MQNKGETMITVPLHSMTDLITNSSTTIYTYSDASEAAMKALVDEFFKAFGIDKTCDDVFTLRLLPDLGRLTDHYYEHIGDLDVAIKPTEKLDYYKIHDAVEAALTGTAKAPMWMRVIDATHPFKIDEEDEYERGCGTTLYITPKDPKHAELAKLFSNFLYSTRSEEGEC